MTFDIRAAGEYLAAREQQRRQQREKERLRVLEATIPVLRQIFQELPVKVFLVGSLVRPGAFYPHSDIDVAVEGYTGDRLDLWLELDRRLSRPVDLIIIEKCSFPEMIYKHGLRVR